MRRKYVSTAAVMLAATLTMTACVKADAEVAVQDEIVSQTEGTTEVVTVATASEEVKYEDAVKIILSDEVVFVNGEAAAAEASESIAVYVSNDIIYYEDKDQYESGNPYGEGTDDDKHSAEEAAAHTVVNITKPGTYHVTGQLSAGQIFVNVGEEETDKVTLILDGVDITCTVAPAVMFYEVYECDADASEDTASYDVDTSNAGAKVIIADGSVNNVSGSYIARIYKDDEEEKKLHKYDGAFYSKMSMEMTGEELGDGILNITAQNEGLDTEMHLTINGGNININSLNDGINVNEDGISVCTINGGNLNIQSMDGEEGDGIDSNGWLVINGGTVIASSNPTSQDAGIDSDMGIYINGGTVIACGNMYDNVEAESAANTMVMQFMNGSKGNLTVKNESDEEVLSFDFIADYTNVVISSAELMEGTYHIYNGDIQLSYTGMMKGMHGRPGMENGEQPQMQEGERPEMPDGEVPAMAEGERPEMLNGEKPQMAEGERLEKPEGEKAPNKDMSEPKDGQESNGMSGEKNTEFVIQKGINFFGGMTECD